MCGYVKAYVFLNITCLVAKPHVWKVNDFDEFSEMQTLNPKQNACESLGKCFLKALPQKWKEG